jgi:hypothetical protein
MSIDYTGAFSLITFFGQAKKVTMREQKVQIMDVGQNLDSRLRGNDGDLSRAPYRCHFERSEKMGTHLYDGV